MNVSAKNGLIFIDRNPISVPVVEGGGGGGAGPAGGDTAGGDAAAAQQEEEEESSEKSSSAGMGISINTVNVMMTTL